MAITSPTDISGCVLWLDPGTITATDGDPISAWADQSGQGNDASSSGSNRPTYRDGSNYYHAQPTVEFSNVAHRLTVAADASLDNGETTYAVMCRLENLNANTDPAWLCNKVNTNAGTVGLRIADSDVTDKGLYEGFFRLSATPGTVRTLDSRGAYRGAWVLVVFRYDGSTGELYIDEALSDSTAVSGAIDTASSDALYIGNHGTNDLAWRGQIGDFVVFDSALSDADLHDLYYWFLTKYPNSEYRTRGAILNSGIRHVRVRSKVETGDSLNHMVAINTDGSVDHYTSDDDSPHGWELADSDIVTLDASYRTCDFLLVGSTWYLYIDRASGNGEIELHTGTAWGSLSEHGSSPVITGSAGDYTRTPTVHEASGTWNMLVDVRTDSLLGEQGHLDRYTSSDGVSWTDDTGNNPVFSATGNGFEGGNIAHPHVLKIGSTIHLTYAGFNEQHPLDTARFPHEIGFATSTDFINFTRSNKNPVITYRDYVSAFDQYLIANPCRWDVGNGELALYYSGMTNASALQPGYATPLNVTGNPVRARWANSASTQLNGAISAVDTTLVVDSVATLPDVPEFPITIDNEIMLVTAIDADNLSLTISRGQEGTSAASHADNATVDLYLTKNSIDRAFQDSFGLTDYPLNVIYNNNVELAHDDFTWLNQGSATSAAADDGGILLTCPSEAADQIRGKYISTPATPWKLTTYCMLGPGMLDYTGTAGDGSYMGPMLRDSTGKLYMFVLRGDRIALWRMTNETTFSAEVDTYLNNNRHAMWLQIENDGTDIKAHVSVDGYVWEEAFNEGRTAFMTSGPTQVGFGMSSGNGAAGMHFYLKTWILE